MDDALSLPSPRPSGRPLVVTGDEVLLDALLRLVAASGETAEVAPDAVVARRLWATAPLVLIGADQVTAVAGGSPPRRPDVLVVARGTADLPVWQGSVQLGAERVLALPAEEPWLTARLTEVSDRRAGRPGLTFAVVGACGGAGASTFVAALGVEAAERGAAVMLLDADPLGGGIDLVLGSESAPGVRWSELMGTSGRVSAASLRDALPRVGELCALSWGRGAANDVPPAVMREVLSAARRGNDVVVVDLPRRPDAAAEEVLVHADLTCVVVPAEVRAVAAATRLLPRLDAIAPRVELVVRGPGPAGLDGPLVGETLGLPLAVEMRAERGLRSAVDLGEGLWRRRRGPLARAARAVLERELGSARAA